MSFKDKYTTTDMKKKVIDDTGATQEMKDKENSKIVISNDAYVNAEVLESLIQMINLARRTN